jgi:phosphoglycolate phosphatase-like HAD superfamily hydrolase
MASIKLQEIKTLIFDLDGVITSENKYWNTARLTVWELITSPDYLALTNYWGEPIATAQVLEKLGQVLISNEFIYQLKSRAVNSNWDLTFFVLRLHLVGILSQYQQQAGSLEQSMLIGDRNIQAKLYVLGQQLQSYTYELKKSEQMMNRFWLETQTLRGSEVLEHVNIFLARQLGAELTNFAPKNELWQLCYRNFQAWYEGYKNYQLPDEETAIDLSLIQDTLAELSKRYSLAIATGRPRNEVISPLQKMDLLKYFDSQRIVTYDDVLEAESVHYDSEIHLGKPHPFILYKAIYPEIEITKLCNDCFHLKNPQTVAYIGDAGSDVIAAKRAGCLSIGVLTGFSQDNTKVEKEKLLQNLGCDIVLDSILELPSLFGV